MRRRSSGSVAEEEGDNPVSNADVTATSEGAGGCSKSDNSSSKKGAQGLQTRTRQSNPLNTSHELDRRKSIEKRPSTARSRRPSSTNWKPAESRNGQLERSRSTEPPIISVSAEGAIAADKMPTARQNAQRSRQIGRAHV